MPRDYQKSSLTAACLFVYLSNSIAAVDSGPSPGDIVASFIIPSEFKSMNGIAWDGSHLWGVDFRSSTPNSFSKYVPSFLKEILFSKETQVAGANAYRLDIANTKNGEVPVINRVLTLGYPELEGLAHDGKNLLLVGPRTDGTRASAKIVAVNDNDSTVFFELTDFLWPDGEKHGSYKDPDGIAYDDGSVLWLANAGHSDVPAAAIQLMNTDGEVIKRFWLPDKMVNDIAYSGGHLIYKPADNNVIRLIAVDDVNNGDIAEISKTIPIKNGVVTGHWGVAYDSEQSLYVSQDPGGGMIWKIHLPASVFE